MPDRPLDPPASDDLFGLLPVGPYKAHAYWEIGKQVIVEYREQVGDLLAPLIIRFYPESTIRWEEGRRDAPFDVVLKYGAGNHYVDLASPGLSLRAEIGVRSRDGEFLPIRASEPIELPRDDESPIFEDLRMNVREGRDSLWNSRASAGKETEAGESLAGVGDRKPGRSQPSRSGVVPAAASEPGAGIHSASEQVSTVVPRQSDAGSPQGAPIDAGPPIGASAVAWEGEANNPAVAGGDPIAPDLPAAREETGNGDAPEILQPAILPKELAAGIVSAQPAEPYPGETPGAGAWRAIHVADAALSTDDEPLDWNAARPPPPRVRERSRDEALSGRCGHGSVGLSSWRFSPMGRPGPSSPSTRD